MIVLGRKCPACGSKQLAVRPPNTAPGWLPAATSMVCERCLQAVVFALGVSVGVENRRYTRKILPPHFLVRISGRTSRFARIRNISEGGICFDQPIDAAPGKMERYLMLDLFNCNDGSSLEQLSTEIVATHEQFLEIKGLPTVIHTNGARFVNLNDAQKKVLLACINQHGVA